MAGYSGTPLAEKRGIKAGCGVGLPLPLVAARKNGARNGVGLVAGFDGAAGCVA